MQVGFNPLTMYVDDVRKYALRWSFIKNLAKRVQIYVQSNRIRDDVDIHGDIFMFTVSEQLARALRNLQPGLTKISFPAKCPTVNGLNSTIIVYSIWIEVIPEMTDHKRERFPARKIVYDPLYAFYSNWHATKDGVDKVSVNECLQSIQSLIFDSLKDKEKQELRKFFAVHRNRKNFYDRVEFALERSNDPTFIIQGDPHVITEEVYEKWMKLMNGMSS
jgi:hypothetical protein